MFGLLNHCANISLNVLSSSIVIFYCLFFDVYRRILQQPPGFVLCVKTLCKTYQSHLWAKLEGSSFLWHLLSCGEWSCPVKIHKFKPCACLAAFCNIQASAAGRACQQLQDDSNINTHTFWEENVETWWNLNPPAIQSSELETQEEISLKRVEKEKDAEISEKDAEISFCSWGIFFLQADELFKTWDE